MDENLTELPFDLPGRIFRSPMPYGRDDDQGSLLNAYRQEGVNVVVMLASEDECLRKTGRNLRRLYEKSGMQVIYMPVEDYQLPELGALRQTVEQILAHAQAGRSVVVHCSAGCGRTGAVLACLARRVFDLGADEAIEWVRNSVPCAVERGQDQVVKDFIVKA